MTAYPLPFFLLFLAVVLGIMRLAPRGRDLAPATWDVRAAVVLAVTSAATLVLCVGTYLALDGYFDHIEPSVAALSWLWARGDPVYVPAGSPRVYSLLYGPMTVSPRPTPSGPAAENRSESPHQEETDGRRGAAIPTASCAGDR